MWSLESNWKRQEGSCHPFLKILILLLHKCKLNLFQWISIYFIYQIKLSSYCNSPSFLAQTCVRDFSNWRILTSGLTAHLTHHSLCQVLIRRQTSIDTRDFLFRTKWTSILVKKKQKRGLCVSPFKLFSREVIMLEQKLSCWANGKRCPSQAWDDLPYIPYLYTQIMSSVIRSI